jgi:hypothetical protein
MSDNQFQAPPDEPKKFNSNTVSNFSDDYNPLDESVNEKPYSQPNFRASAESLGASIPEPNYTAPPVGNEDAYKEINKDMSGGGASSGEKTTVNPSLNEVPNEDKKMAAKHLCNLILDGYSQIKTFANQSLKFSERKINKLVADGEIDLSAPVTYDYGSVISGGEFIKSFNEQVKDTFVVTEEFKKEAKPVLQRVLEKRGAGLTDEQYLIYLFGKDLALDGVTYFQIRRQMSDVIDTMKEYTEAYKQNNPSKGETFKTPPYSPPPPSEPKYEYSAENESYSSGYSEPEETKLSPDFGNPESMDIINMGEEDVKQEKQAEAKKKRGHKVRENHFSGKRKARKKKEDNISDAEIIEENPLD